MKMGEPFLLDGEHQVAKLCIAPIKEMELIFQVAVHCPFDRRSADPDALAAHEGGDKVQYVAAVSP